MRDAPIIIRRTLESIQTPFPLPLSVSLHEALTEILLVKLAPFEKHIIFAEGSGRIPASQILAKPLPEVLDGLYSPLLWEKAPVYFSELRERFGSDECLPCDLVYDGAELLARASIRSLCLYQICFAYVGFTELSQKFLAVLGAMRDAEEIVLGDQSGHGTWIVMSEKNLRPSQ